MIALIRPIIFAFSAPAMLLKTFVIDLLSAYAKRTDNAVDDYAVELIRELLLGEESN